VKKQTTAQTLQHLTQKAHIKNKETKEQSEWK
jgi:hypothetical protein